MYLAVHVDSLAKVYREHGVKVEISHDGEWLTGTTLELLEVGLSPCVPWQQCLFAGKLANMNLLIGLTTLDVRSNLSAILGDLSFSKLLKKYSRSLHLLYQDLTVQSWQDMPSRLKVLVGLPWC